MIQKYLSMRLWMSERGASLAEYALLVMLIAIVAILAVSLAGKEVSGQYSDISSALQQG